MNPNYLERAFEINCSAAKTWADVSLRWHFAIKTFALLAFAAAGTRRPTPYCFLNASRLFRKQALSLLIAAVLLSAFSACSKSGQTAGHSDVDYYTCAMHPSVRSHDPHGKCPICGMDLVPVTKKGSHASEVHADSGMAGMNMPGGTMNPSTGSSDQPTEFTIPLNRQQLIGVTYTQAKRSTVRSVLRAFGTVAISKERHWEYVARVDGYVHELKVLAPGDTVEKDQVLMDVYSPDLVATQNEFVDLIRMRDNAESSGSSPTRENAERLLASARQRLRQWNLSDAQIDTIAENKKASELLTLVSPFRGVVEAVPVDQGRRITTGDHLVDIADLSKVWVWAEFYQDELSSVAPGMPAEITTTSLPGKVFAGKIAVVDPFINEMKRTGRARIEVDNPEFKLRPDMYVDVELAVERGERLIVPVSAVLPTGKRNVVFVDKGGGKLEPR
ncbi:MAG TPA: efflux RND transporter periplasmic adaptor subunit, partial [Opitutaceae bacterium]|nr:efflux RND transporter periplasmic adaptor subunit [Opitutaceae bacterium]